MSVLRLAMQRFGVGAAMSTTSERHVITLADGTEFVIELDEGAIIREYLASRA